MDIPTRITLFVEGKLTQVETIDLLVTASNPAELDLRYGLMDLENRWWRKRVDKDIKTILRKLGIAEQEQRLVRISRESARRRKNLRDKKYTLIVEQSFSKFLSKEASQKETLAILIGATQNSTVKSSVMDAFQKGNLDGDTKFLFRSLGVLPVTC
jgi:hypothetical protein